MPISSNSTIQYRPHAGEKPWHTKLKVGERVATREIPVDKMTETLWTLRQPVHLNERMNHFLLERRSPRGVEHVLFPTKPRWVDE